MSISCPAEGAEEASSFALPLRHIAAWHDIPEITERPLVWASVPVLQRGLVWDPSQIELLWDSILRGFPIGALVLSAKIPEQIKSTDETKPNITHHLLDGQQRCDAIALGYKDAFRVLSGQAEVACITSILWLDLDPTKDEWSTREFVVRLTTPSHPWGYTRGDAAKPLGAREIRDALKRIGQDPSAENYCRPSPAKLCPQAANVPVPLAWLLMIRQDDNFWDALLARLGGTDDLPWHAPLRDFLKDPNKEPNRACIFRALRRIEHTEIIALCAPSDLLSDNRQETESTPERANISSIEHLFQRLNQQGTPLDGEELAYSMIKAYWPKLAGPIDEIVKPMPATRLISLAIRAALAGENRERLPSALGVSQIRKMAGKQDERTASVYDYIHKRLADGCRQSGDWLRYDPGLNPSGLLPVHIASIARDSPDVFLLLLTFAQRPSTDWQLPEPERARCLQALVTVVHWFGRDKLAIANFLFATCREQISRANFQRGLAQAQEAGHLRTVHAPEAVEGFFRELSETALLQWNWGTLGHPEKSEEERQKLWVRWGEFLWFRGQMELLLYVQRDFLQRRFPDYDPARKDFWKGHNRPWDFDHILAKTYVHSKQGKFKGACAEWVNTIGNFRAWPMEDNRSEQAETALEKLMGEDGTPKQKQRVDSFLEEEELAAFSSGHETRQKQEAAIAFVTACRKRMLSIYRKWYESVGVAELFPAGDQTHVSEIISTPLAAGS